MRSQTRRTDSSRSREKKGKVAPAEDPTAVFTADSTPLRLPPADKEDGKLVEVSSDELWKARETAGVFSTGSEGKFRVSNRRGDSV
ncbi:hypothetical protein AVEN_125368-1 [Araneus ventricosus]|uniref:Uncharacterized protein n=1 Tax=Araneus ventricosus TaxID=182803 RepID=A0A4Y2TAE6_ARAVE|nr:hypothetical protein AVEN_125368-1 [Araneus ventricosus]